MTGETSRPELDWGAFDLAVIRAEQAYTMERVALTLMTQLVDLQRDSYWRECLLSGINLLESLRHSIRQSQQIMLCYSPTYEPF